MGIQLRPIANFRHIENKIKMDYFASLEAEIESEKVPFVINL